MASLEEGVRKLPRKQSFEARSPKPTYKKAMMDDDLPRRQSSIAVLPLTREGKLPESSFQEHKGGAFFDPRRALGFITDPQKRARHLRHLQGYVNLKLCSLGYTALATSSRAINSDFLDTASDLLLNYQEKARLLHNHLYPSDRRIQNFIDKEFEGITLNGKIRLPREQFVLDRHGMAREISFPIGEDEFHSEYVDSYRLKQGVLHNPQRDKRTTKGVFHISEGGLPVPADKIAVPKHVFGNLLYAALHPPEGDMVIPYTADVPTPHRPLAMLCSLLLRPVVCPPVPGVCHEQTMETRFFTPGTLVSCLDFVESVFGNAGDPALPENDAGLNVENWTGHTGCIIMAPHLRRLQKKFLGLPSWDDATEAQRRTGMCWKDPKELYHNGEPFKITHRTMDGVVITLIADNYFGYCKKEVKTQISFSANLFGLSEEEHAGGALTFPSYNLGAEFNLAERKAIKKNGQLFADVWENYGAVMDVHEEGYATDKKFPNVIYVPEDACFNINTGKVSWKTDQGEGAFIRLLPGKDYVYPNGYKVKMIQQRESKKFHLIGTTPEGLLIHKPCTVSGGGKSEISKSISDAIISGPFFVKDFVKDFQAAKEIINKDDYSDRFCPEHDKGDMRTILDPDRSLGSVIKLLTPAIEFKDAYNEWVTSVPDHIKALVFLIKRFYKPEWGDDWEKFFAVDIVDGRPGSELKFHNQKLSASYLRVGVTADKKWRTFKLRQDFHPAEKAQMEDDITASAVVPTSLLSHLNPEETYSSSVKVITNCEHRFFQRPDDAVIRGYDKAAERDMSRADTFISNFQALTHKDARELLDDVASLEEFSQPMKDFITSVPGSDCPYFVCSALMRINKDGKKTTNPRYLQDRQDMVDIKPRFMAEVGARLFRVVPLDLPVHFPVNATIPGRRLNQPDRVNQFPPLCVYNPVHYQELPELFMDFVACLTGRSPSTTGAGSEGALTKGPFNMLCTSADLNNAIVSFILTGYDGFTTAAGYVGPHYRVDHDISLLVPEVWCRMTAEERNAKNLIREGFLERMEDFEFNGQKVLASRLGFRITRLFCKEYLGRIFDRPLRVFDDMMLRPETQDMECFAEGMANIVESQRKAALNYFEDGSIASCCPPLQAILHVMAYGHWKGKTVDDPDLRVLFTKEHMLKSKWYQRRLKVKQERDIALWCRKVDYIAAFLTKEEYMHKAIQLRLPFFQAMASQQLQLCKSAAYLQGLMGTLGADPVCTVDP